VSQPVEPSPASGSRQSRRRQTRRERRLDPARSLGPFDRVIPSWTDPTVRRAAGLIGGPLGRHAQVGRIPVLTPLRVCLLMALLFLVFGWLAKSPCIQQAPGNGGFVLDSSANRQWIAGCYNDVVPAFQIYRLGGPTFPYAGTDHAALPYPVVIGGFMWLVGRISSLYLGLTGGILPRPLDVAAYFTIGAILLGLCYLWAVSSTLRIARRRPWDTAIMCLSPLLVVHAFSNYDAIPIALLAAGLLSWSRGRPGWAGVWLGLGVAAKLYPLLLLVPLVILAVRTGRISPVLVTTFTAAVSWAAVNVPVALAWPDAWAAFYTANTNRKAEFTTVWAIFSDWSHSSLFDPTLGTGEAPALLNTASALLFGVAVIGIAWLGLATERRPRLAQLLFLTVAAFLLVTKTWNPQFSLWLLPLAVLALPRWRPVIVWQLVEAALWFLLMLTFATRGDSTAQYALLSQYPYQNVALLRDVLVIVMMAMVVRDILRPSGDLVRQAGDDDPAGGVFEDAPDRFTLPSWRAVLGFRGREPELVGTEKQPDR
jgi:uncharacterized membrane protein